MGKVHIISMGAVCAAGKGVETGFKAVLAGTDGLTPLETFDAGLQTPPLCAQYRAPVETLTTRKVSNRSTAFAFAALEETLEKVPEHHGLRTGLVTATTVAGISRSETFYKAFIETGTIPPRADRELAAHLPNALSGELARAFDIHGFHSLSTACSTGIHAIGMAKRLIDCGEYDLCVALGTDALCLLTVRGFHALTLLAPNGCAPFDAERAGISLGEGAGALLLASDKALNTLGLESLAVVKGWGASADAHHMTAPHPQGSGAVIAITDALDEAGIDPEMIDFIIAHGTATPDNDSSEIAALQSVFTALPPFCSVKRTIGHTLAASGVIESIFAVKTMHENTTLPTGGFKTPDKNIGVHPSPVSAIPIRTVLKNAFGFGGNNASMVFTRD